MESITHITNDNLSTYILHIDQNEQHSIQYDPTIQAFM